MRIVHVLNSVDLNLGGVACAVLGICRYLQQSGIDTWLITRKRLEHVADWTEENSELPTLVELPGTHHRSGRLEKSDQDFLEDFLQPGDVVHLHGVWEPLNHWAARICLKRSVPYCISTHGMLDDWSMSQKRLKKLAYWFAVARKTFQNALVVHTTAEAEKLQVEKWVSQSPLAVVPCVFETDIYEHLPGAEKAAAEFSIREDEKILLFLSRVHVKKGVELLIEAMQSVRQKHPEARVLIAGLGAPEYVESIKQLILRQGLGDCAELLGPVHGETKLSLYQRADLFVLPTHQENFGLVLPEAMACETPVVTTRGVDIWREIQAGGATIVDRDAESLAAALNELFCDRQALRELGQRGRDWVFDTLDPRKVIRQYVAMYEGEAA